MTTNQHPNPIRDLFRFYWETYGGFDEVIRSFYLRAALVLGIVTAPGWISREWWDLPLSVLPNVLGFTIAGFAIFLSLGDDTFRRAITGKVDGEEGPSPYLDVGVSIFHFTVVQVIAIVVGGVAKLLKDVIFVIPSDCLSAGTTNGWWALRCLFGWLIAICGNVMFFYALGCALGVAVLLLQLMKSYDENVEK